MVRLEVNNPTGTIKKYREFAISFLICILRLEVETFWCKPCVWDITGYKQRQMVH